MLALHAVTSSGDTVAIESPCCFGTLHLLEELRLRSIELPTDPRAGVSLEAIEKLAAQRGRIAAVVLSPTVQNPLGSVVSDEKKRRIAELLSKKRIPIIEDDAGGDLAYDEPRPKYLKAFDATETVMLCGSFSSTIGPGYRVGWIAPGKWREEIIRLKQAYSLASTTVTQLAVAEYLDGRRFDRHLRRIRTAYREQMRLLQDAVGRYFSEGTKATHPAGGFLLWVELPRAVDTAELYENAVKKGVGFAPGAIFSPTARYRNCLRLHAALPWCARVDDAIETLGRLVSRELHKAVNR
jgi:DNA-binding transcriptional MocR family regulator